MLKKETIILAAGAILLVVATASASMYWAKQDDKVDAVAPAAGKHIEWNDSQASAAPPAQPNCDDGNVVGKVIGGVGGGAAASNIGGGKGKTAATIAGTLGGAYLGGEYIPTKNATCRN